MVTLDVASYYRPEKIEGMCFSSSPTAAVKVSLWASCHQEANNNNNNNNNNNHHNHDEDHHEDDDNNNHHNHHNHNHHSDNNNDSYGWPPANDLT